MSALTDRHLCVEKRPRAGLKQVTRLIRSNPRLAFGRAGKSAFTVETNLRIAENTFDALLKDGTMLVHDALVIGGEIVRPNNTEQIVA